ncbi:MAG: hypothetical protein JXB49_26265 [Bacteroidales bacterium]|nr:hypothetical protein [Bacteroidales bacterium]
MAGKIEWITHEGRKILFNDRSGLRNEEIKENVKSAVDLIMSLPQGDILYLIDNSNTIITPELKEYISKAAKTINPKVKKTAVLGASRSQQIMLNIYSATTGMNIRLFDTKEAALKYLVK